MMIWILCLALLAGATRASEEYVQNKVQPQNMAVLQQFPSVVQIEFYLFWSTMEWVHECVGTILTSRMIMSPASCTSGWSYEPRFRRIRAGSNVRNTGGIIFYVQDRVNHPSWGNAYEGDINVIRTMHALVYSPVIQQASIASPGSWLPHNLRLNQPSWGRAAQPLITNNEVVTAPISSCGRRDGNFSSTLNATANILCVIPQGSNTTHNYDVGAPWIINGVTVGLVGGVNTVEVYNGRIGINVAGYTPWIVEIVSTWF